MKNTTHIYRTLIVMFSAALLIHLSGSSVFAAEAAGDWRPTYDLVMRWVNFLILAFIIVKFGKGPIMNFLNAQKDEVADEIGRMEQEKDEMLKKIQETRETLAESDVRFAELKERIVRDGERKRQAIIDQAKDQSEIMMSTAKQKISSQILEAKRTFKAEMVDMAVEMAGKRLPTELTEEDNQRMVDSYLKSAAQK